MIEIIIIIRNHAFVSFRVSTAIKAFSEHISGGHNHVSRYKS